jgi:hypothetical protein
VRFECNGFVCKISSLLHYIIIIMMVGWIRVLLMSNLSFACFMFNCFLSRTALEMRFEASQGNSE